MRRLLFEMVSRRDVFIAPVSCTGCEMSMMSISKNAMVDEDDRIWCVDCAEGIENVLDENQKIRILRRLGFSGDMTHLLDMFASDKSEMQRFHSLLDRLHLDAGYAIRQMERNSNRYMN